MTLQEWKERAPRLVEECAQLWSLRLGEPYEHANLSDTRPVELPDGTPAVLKVGFPHHESEHEADALTHYGGRGAVRLLAHDPARNAMLLERCDPGMQLWAVEDDEEATRSAAGVLRSLWRVPAPDHPFDLLTAEVALWTDEIRARGGDRALADAAIATMRELVPTQGELVVCHQDLHGGNVLRAQRGWLAIDPKPVAGEREFDTASLIRDRRATISVPIMQRRIDILVDELGLDRERTHAWAFAHAMAWDHPSVASLLRL